jgi:hypothetical protein
MSDLDGIEKNIDKFKKEWAKLKTEMKPHWGRFFKSPIDGHSYVNLFVEARRCSPYLIGHIDAVLYPLLIALLIKLS